jgi:hypothetical protein
VLTRVPTPDDRTRRLLMPLSAPPDHAAVSALTQCRSCEDGVLRRRFEREVAMIEADFADRKRSRTPAERFVIVAVLSGSVFGMFLMFSWDLLSRWGHRVGVDVSRLHAGQAGHLPRAASSGVRSELAHTGCRSCHPPDHQRKAVCVKLLVGAALVVCPCIAVIGLVPCSV